MTRVAGPGETPTRKRAERRAKLKLLAAVMVPAWGRAVLAIVGATIVTSLAGLGDVSNYAVIPGVYMALSGAVGSVYRRIGAVTAATGVIAVLSFVGAELSRSTVAVVVGLAVVGFVMGLLPRAGPMAAAMQLPMLMGFAYSAGQPLAEASAASRAGAILVGLPVYVIATAVLFQVDQRRPLLLGAAAGLGGVAQALGKIARAEAGAAQAAEAALVKFRVASSRLKDAAVPVGGSLDSRAGRLLTVSLQQAVGAVELLAAGGRDLGEKARTQGATLAEAAGALAAALANRGPTPPVERIDEVAREARADRDIAVTSLAEAVADAARAVAVLRGETRRLPEDALVALPSPVTRLRAALTPDDPAFRRAVRLAAACSLAGLVAELSDLSRVYWAIFAAVVVLNAPAALDWRRGLMRIGGTVLGFLLAIPLIALVNHHSTLSLVLGLLVLLPGLLLMPINYGAAVVFITAAVGMMFTSSGEQADFLKYRIAENAIGVAVVCAVGLLLWRTKRSDWWLSAGRMAGALAGGVHALEPGRARERMATEALALRAETVEVEAIAGTPPSFAAAWTYLAAGEDMSRLLGGPHAESPADSDVLAAALRDVERECRSDAAPEALTQSPPPPLSSLAHLELARMQTAVRTLKAQV